MAISSESSSDLAENRLKVQALGTHSAGGFRSLEFGDLARKDR